MWPPQLTISHCCYHHLPLFVLTLFYATTHFSHSYVATPAIFFAMALCVLEERGRLPLGGVLTPASAFYDVPSIFDRLALGNARIVYPQIFNAIDPIDTPLQHPYNTIVHIDTPTQYN